MKLLHRIMHRLGWYSGVVVSKTIKGSVWVGFRCSDCGRIEGLCNMDEVIERDLANAIKKRKLTNS